MCKPVVSEGDGGSPRAPPGGRLGEGPGLRGTGHRRSARAFQRDHVPCGLRAVGASRGSLPGRTRSLAPTDTQPQPSAPCVGDTCQSLPAPARLQLLPGLLPAPRGGGSREDAACRAALGARAGTRAGRDCFPGPTSPRSVPLPSAKARRDASSERRRRGSREVARSGAALPGAAPRVLGCRQPPGSGRASCPSAFPALPGDLGRVRGRARVRFSLCVRLPCTAILTNRSGDGSDSMASRADASRTSSASSLHQSSSGETEAGWGTCPGVPERPQGGDTRLRGRPAWHWEVIERPPPACAHVSHSPWGGYSCGAASPLSGGRAFPEGKSPARSLAPGPARAEAGRAGFSR